MTAHKSLTEQASILFAGNVLALLIGLLVPMVNVRVFTRDEYGLYQQLFLIFTTMLPLGEIGVTQGLFYFLPREPEKRDAVITQTFMFVSGTGLLCCLILFVFKSPIAELMNNPQMAGFMPALAVFVLFMIASSFFETLMIAERKLHAAALVRVISELTRALTVVITAIATRSVYSVFVALICFSLARFSFQIYYIYKRYTISFKKIDIAFLRRQLAYSIPIGLSNVAFLLQQKLHSFFVSFLFVPEIFAVYAIGTYNLPFIGLITTSVSKVMVPELSQCQKEDDEQRILAIWFASVRKMNLFFFPLFVYFFLMAHEFIITLFTKQYLESVGLFRIALVCILIHGFSAGPMLNAYAESTFQMKIGFLRLFLALLFLYFFTKVFGLHGAVLSNVVVLAMMHFIMIIKISKVMNIPSVKLFMPFENARIMVVAVVAGIPVLIMKYLFLIPPLAVLIISALIFFPTYIFTSFCFGNVSSSEIRALRNLCYRRLNIIARLVKK